MGPVIKFATFEIYTSEVFNYKFNSMCGSKSMGTFMSQIVEHTEIDEHLGEIAENLIVEHLQGASVTNAKILLVKSF